MNYEETLAYLYQQLPMFSRIGSTAYKKDLTNTIALCSFLGDPHQKFKTIHIAGTNGKGSTSHMLAAILQQAGYKTGLYTSPHIKDFRERIRINGEMISKNFVVDFVQKTKAVAEDIKPSFFELTVAMAFDYFAAERVDIAVIETGLGGRLDSTNVISPILSVITNIGYDHMNMLGNTLTEIAGEKAGIIKKGIPVVIGEKHPETLPVFLHKASIQNAPVCFAAEKLKVTNPSPEGRFLNCTVRYHNSGETENYKLDLVGLYQSSNLCTVLAAIEVLNENGFNVSHETTRQALEQVKKLTGIAGRWDVVQNNPTVILDVGHNEDGIKEIVRQLKNDYPESGYHFVIGFVNDKDVSKVLPLFPREASFYFTNAHIPRAMPHEKLEELALENKLTGIGYENVNVALEAAKRNAGPGDVIVVCGSFFVIAELELTG